MERHLLTSIDPGPKKYLGLPVSLQLVGRRYEDEKVRWPYIHPVNSRHSLIFNRTDR